MTTITNFDIATDLKVEFFLAGGGKNDFIIGVSKIGGVNVLAGLGIFYIGESLIGGEDVLGGDFAFEWTDLNCVTAEASLSVGGDVIDQLYFQPLPAQANLQLQSFNFDPNYSPAFRPGVKVRVKLVKDELDQIIWSGVVDSITATYDKNGNNILEVLAYDNFKQLVNTRLALFDSTTDFPEGYVTSYEQLELIAEQDGSAMHPTSTDPGGRIPSTILDEVIPTDLIYEAIQVGLGIFWLDPETEEFVFVPRPTDTEIPEGTPVIGNNHLAENHLCMTDITTSATDDTVYNSLKVILSSDPEVSTLRENLDSIELYGRYARDVTLNTTDLEELDNWADLVFQQSPTSLVDSVQTLTKDRQGNLTEAAFFLPGEKVGVDFTEDILVIDDFFTITKVSHFIDPDNWRTTLDLWKEA